MRGIYVFDQSSDHQLKFPTASKEEDDDTTHPTLYLPTSGSLIM